jgi:hypothetical protein
MSQFLWACHIPAGHETGGESRCQTSLYPEFALRLLEGGGKVRLENALGMRREYEKNRFRRDFFAAKKQRWRYVPASGLIKI